MVIQKCQLKLVITSVYTTEDVSLFALHKKPKQLYILISPSSYIYSIFLKLKKKIIHIFDFGLHKNMHALCPYG